MATKRRRAATATTTNGDSNPAPPDTQQKQQQGQQSKKKREKQQKELSLLDRVRNMEEFAALGQYLFMFGSSVLKLPDFGREELETALLGTDSELLQKIQLALIRVVTSNRSLVLDQFSEFTRRQYLSKKPAANPFGDEKAAKKLLDLDIFTRIRVLHQLSIWSFVNPDRVRGKMTHAGGKEQLTWRIEPCGYDRDGNTYYMLDDNRLYRRTPWEAPRRPTITPKKSKVKGKGNKRRRMSTAVDKEKEEEEAVVKEDIVAVEDMGMDWSLVCVTLQEWEEFVKSLGNSQNDDEEALYEYLRDDVLPEIRAVEERRKKILLGKERERLRQDAVANRKRSSRIDAKMVRQREEEEKAAEARKEAELLEKAQLEQKKREILEQQRELRMITRERRIKEEEMRRTLDGHVQSNSGSGEDLGCSGRRRSARRVSTKVEVVKCSEKDKWVFDCICGLHGINYEDGSEIIGCDRCDVWQHLKCQDLSPGFKGDFLCDRCKRQKEISANSEATTKSPKIATKLWTSNGDLHQSNVGAAAAAPLSLETSASSTRRQSPFPAMSQETPNGQTKDGGTQFPQSANSNGTIEKNNCSHPESHEHPVTAKILNNTGDTYGCGAGLPPRGSSVHLLLDPPVNTDSARGFVSNHKGISRSDIHRPGNVSGLSTPNGSQQPTIPTTQYQVMQDIPGVAGSTGCASTQKALSGTPIANLTRPSAHQHPTVESREVPSSVNGRA